MISWKFQLFNFSALFDILKMNGDLQEQAEHLGKLVTGGDFPHLLVYGPPGAGKKTRVISVGFATS